MFAAALRVTARGLVALGAVALIAAAIFPASLSAYVPLALALWVLALLMTLARTYILRAPMPGRGGLFEYKEHPIAYHTGFLVAVGLFGFILTILLRAYIAS